MQLSETIRLYPSKEYNMHILNAMQLYIDTVNSIVSDAVIGTDISKMTTADFVCELPSCIKNQIIRDAKSVYKKYSKSVNKYNKKVAAYKSHNKDTDNIKVPNVPILSRKVLYINNQNYRIKDSCISFPLMINGKSTRISVPTKITDKQLYKLSECKLGTMRICIKNNHLLCQIVYEQDETISSGTETMGIDLGIKCPAVSYISNGKVKFYGNGRKNKYMRRHYRYLRRKLQKAKKPKAVERIGQKEQRIMNDIDHKLSREIVNTAKANNVKIIQMERLDNIRSTARTSRKNNPSLHTWSFYRLANYIEYKAKLEGIEVVYVNPAYTSQICPCCGSKNHAKDRRYICSCGYQTHRDLVGAINICNSTEYAGDTSIRHIA